jgi:hypothetical protein
MSVRNDPLNKSQRRVERHAQKRAAAKRISHGGVIVRPTDVRRQRYLERIGEQFSKTMASVALPRKRQTFSPI